MKNDDFPWLLSPTCQPALPAGTAVTLEVGNFPGRALSFAMRKGGEPRVISFPSKSVRPGEGWPLGKAWKVEGWPTMKQQNEGLIYGFKPEIQGLTLNMDDRSIDQWKW